MKYAKPDLLCNLLTRFPIKNIEELLLYDDHDTIQFALKRSEIVIAPKGEPSDYGCDTLEFITMLKNKRSFKALTTTMKCRKLFRKWKLMEDRDNAILAGARITGFR